MSASITIGEIIEIQVGDIVHTAPATPNGYPTVWRNITFKTASGTDFHLILVPSYGEDVGPDALRRCISLPGELPR